MCFRHPFIIWALLPPICLWGVWTVPYLNYKYPSVKEHISIMGWTWRVFVTLGMIAYEAVCLIGLFNPC